MKKKQNQPSCCVNSFSCSLSFSALWPAWLFLGVPSVSGSLGPGSIWLILILFGSFTNENKIFDQALCKVKNQFSFQFRLRDLGLIYTSFITFSRSWILWDTLGGLLSTVITLKFRQNRFNTVAFWVQKNRGSIDTFWQFESAKLPALWLYFERLTSPTQTFKLLISGQFCLH